jgi:hypothetical protein
LRRLHETGDFTASTLENLDAKSKWSEH